MRRAMPVKLTEEKIDLPLNGSRGAAGNWMQDLEAVQAARLLQQALSRALQ